MGEGDAIVRPPTIRAELRMGTPSITIRLHAWATWARIAIDHERYAYERQSAGDSLDFEAGLVALTAAAFALDALYDVAFDYIPPDKRPATSRGSVNRGDRGRKVAEWLRQAVAPGGGRTQSWSKRFEKLFDDRDDAVHYDEAEEAPVPHPTRDTHVEPHAVIWGPAAATEAVDLLVDVLLAWIEQPNQFMRGWVGQYEPLVRDVISRRR